MAMFNSYVSLPEGSWFYMHWELAILRYCGDILSMFETQDFKAKSQNIEGIELSNLTQQLPCRMGWKVCWTKTQCANFGGSDLALGITKQWGPAWRVRLHDSFSGCEPAVFWMAFPFFSWRFENCQRIWCSVRARMCLEENSDNTSESLIAESQRHIWGELRGSARFRYSKYCRISTLLCFTPASWDQITDRDNKTHQPFGTRDSPKTLSLVTLNYRL